MALNLDFDNCRAYRSSPWTGGDATWAFHMRKTGAFTRAIAGFNVAADGSQIESGVGMAPRASVGSSASNGMSSAVVNSSDSAVSSAVTPNAYVADTWVLVLVRWVGSSYSVTTQLAVNDAWGSISGSARDLTGIDTFQFGSNNTSESDSHIAHFGFWNRALSDSQCTELLTTLPTGVSGGAPDEYESFLVDEGDFTLSTATIDNTYDGTIPALGAGGSAGVALKLQFMMGA